MDEGAKDIDLGLLSRYFAGECTPEEVAVVTTWAVAKSGRREELERMRAVWNRAQALPPAELRGGPVDIDNVLARITARMRAKDGSAGRAERSFPARSSYPVSPVSRPTPFGVKPRGRHVTIVWRAIAAVLVVGLSGTLLWRTQERHRAPAPAQIELAAREIVTRRGQRAEVRLSDGTRVVLAPEGRLRIPGDGKRDIELEGEAFFDVVHDEDHPFRVRTATGVAEDIGTSFVVSSYPEMHATRVAVASGSVALGRHGRAVDSTIQVRNAQNDAPAVVLIRGDVGRIDESGHVAVRHNVSIERYMSWTEGRLIFDGVTFAEAIPRLNRWFDLDIRIADSVLTNERLAGAFGSTDAATDVLNGIALTLNARVERRGRVARFFRHP